MPDGDPQVVRATLFETLVYVSNQEPGIRRRRAGQGFAYRDAAGEALRDPTTLERIRQLAIPPAWTDVWICADPRGHIQAVGRDARGRKQYRYHADWRAERSTTSTTAWPRSAARCRACARGRRPISPATACRARRCWPPPCASWRSP